MKRVLVPLLGVLVALPLLLPATPALADGCTFQNGFKALHDAIPAIVGDCLGNEYSLGPEQTQQPTTRGVLRWQAYVSPALQDYAYFSADDASYWFGSEAQCFRPPVVAGTFYYAEVGVCRAPDVFMPAAVPPPSVSAAPAPAPSVDSLAEAICRGNGGTWRQSFAFPFKTICEYP